MWLHRGCDDCPFLDVIEPFLAACPGPPLSEFGLRVMAGQRVKGIPGLESGEWMRANRVRIDDRRERYLPREQYLRSVVDIAPLVNVRPGYLSEAALRKGYQYSRALRWIRFLHGLWLDREGHRNLRLAWKIGFCDPSGWTRFVAALTGSVPSRLPRRPLEDWVKAAIEDVYGDGLG